MPYVSVPAGQEPIHIRALSMRPEFLQPWLDMLHATYRNSLLSRREREAVRYRLALLNGCLLCQQSRTYEGIDESFYAGVAAYSWPEGGDGLGFTTRELLCLEFAERFSSAHREIDEDFFARLRTSFTDSEIIDLTFCCARDLGFGRMTHVLGLDDNCELATEIDAINRQSS